MNQINRILVTLTITSLVAGVLACGGIDPEEEELSSAVPTRDDLALMVPAGSSSSSQSGEVGTIDQALLGQRADMYQLTYSVSRSLNRSIWVGLNIIEGIVQQPPTFLQSGVATWGPWTPPLEPLTWMLNVQRKGPGKYAYALSARRKGHIKGKFVTILAGTSVKGYSKYFSGFAGTYWANASALNKLDPLTYQDTGKMAATYDTTGVKRAIKLVLTDYSDNGGDKVNAAYTYLDRVDASGEFKYATRVDLHKDKSLSKKELYTVKSRWTAAGAGRGDATASGGDLPASVKVEITECWDALFRRVFYQDNYNTNPAEGSAAKCVFKTAL